MRLHHFAERYLSVRMLVDDRVNVQGGWFVFMSVLILLIPIKLVLAWLLSVAFHEMCHVLVLGICRVPIHGFRITCNGVCIMTDLMSPPKELFCALAGPVGGFLLVLFGKIWPCLAVCSVALSIFNLIPLYPYDGGRILHSLLTMLLPLDQGEKIMTRLKRIILFSSLAFGTVVLIQGMGMIPLLLIFMIWFRSSSRNFPCKARKQIVQ